MRQEQPENIVSCATIELPQQVRARQIGSAGETHSFPRRIRALYGGSHCRIVSKSEIDGLVESQRLVRQSARLLSHAMDCAAPYDAE